MDAVEEKAGESEILPTLLHLDLELHGTDGPSTSTPASSRPSVLVVGDGDLSYGSALASVLGRRARMLVTGFDSAADVMSHHPSAEIAEASIIEQGGVVMHGVDGTRLHDTSLEHAPFSRIVWLFPQSPQWRKIDRHRALLRDFFASCADPSVLSPEGCVYVALLAGQGGTRAEPAEKTRRTGDTWQLVECAAVAGMVLIDVRPAHVEQLTSHGYSPKGLRGRDRTFLGNSSDGALLHILQRDGTRGGVELQVPQFDPPVHVRDICFWVDPAVGASLSDNAAFVEEFNEAFAALARQICKSAGADTVDVSLFDQGYVDPGDRKSVV